MDYKTIENAAFPVADEAAWRKLAEKALRGADFEATLVSHTDDGIAYGPIHARVAEQNHRFRAVAGKPWSVCQRIDDGVAARAAQQVSDDLENGAGAVSVALAGSAAAFGFGVAPGAIPELADAISGAGPDAIWLDPGDRFDIASELAARCPDTPLHCGLDIWSHRARFGARSADLGAFASAMGSLIEGRSPGTVLRADGRVAHDAGASEAQELAFVLASVTENLRLAEKAGLDIETVFARTSLGLCVDQDQFVSTAKLRALRSLYAALQTACGFDAPSPALVHAETSFRMLTRQDPETSILRNTIAAFAAGIGGADTVTVLPHSLLHGLPDSFARRIARNTQIVLIEECHLDHVLDPSCGAGGIEHLTGRIAAEAWRAFQAVEAEGGLAKSLASGAFQGRVAAVRERRAARIASGDEPIIGTTLYPPSRERPLDVLENRPAAGAEDPDTLAPAPLYTAWQGGNA